MMDARMPVSGHPMRARNRFDDDDELLARQQIEPAAADRFARLLHTTGATSGTVTRTGAGNAGPIAHASGARSSTRWGMSQAGGFDVPNTQALRCLAPVGEMTVRLTNGAFAGIEVSVWRQGETVRARIKSGADSRFGCLARAQATLSATLSARLGFPVSIELDDDAAATP